MKLLARDRKHNSAKLLLTVPEDFWYIHRILQEGDIVVGRASRKVLKGSDIVRTTFTATLSVLKSDISDNSLRISGVTCDDNNDVPKGSHQSITASIGDVLTVIKNWGPVDESVLSDCLKSGVVPVLILIIDRDSALFALTNSGGYSVLAKLRGDVQKKYENVSFKEFFPLVVKKLEDLLKTIRVSNIVVGSPGFWKDEFSKHLPKDLKSRTVFATCSDDGVRGLLEVLKKDDLKSVLRDVRASEELSVVENFLSLIHKGGRASYGFVNVKFLAQQGAVEKIVVSTKIISKDRAEKRRDVEDLLSLVESFNGSIMIVSSELEGGSILDGLGGIGAFLRWKSD
ncbi:pelota family protein [Candidatus Woesearchaeota archaeon]|nr:pelota family protein [Candidatus Woesearchaeota archaeon]